MITGLFEKVLLDPKDVRSLKYAIPYLESSNRECPISKCIEAEKIKELLELIASILSRNMIPLKELRTFAGKAMNIASLIVIWRPFLAACWAAPPSRLMSSMTRTRASYATTFL